jgi:peptidoglycan/LPS O-acetylase OafA/YrhL
VGSVRTLLAICVVIFHSYGIFGEKMAGGTVAVQAFYMISGFYMALILNEKYKAGKGSYKLFITNRFLRIYPAYWFCLLLVVLICVVGKIGWDQPFYLWYWTSTWDTMHWSAIAIFIFANVFLLGSDWLFFSGLNKQTGRLELTHTPFAYTPMSFQNLFIPQIWSIGVEITFYLFAPFLLRRKWYLQAIVLIASLALRYWLYNVKLWYFDPWDYRFFPTELAFFMAGSLAYRAYVYLQNIKIPQWINLCFWSMVITGIIFYPRVSFFTESYFRWYFYAFFALSLPFIFLLSRKSKVDRIIGELSYPVYVSHHFIMFLWRQYFFTHVEYLKWFGITCVISTLLFSWMLYKGVILPMEKIRQKRVPANPLAA